MLEDILFGNVVMPGEMVRIVIAILGTGVGAYFDLFNRKNVPDQFLYAFLAIALLTNLVFLNVDLFIFTLILAILVSGIGYIFYRVGQLGGADVFIIASIMLLLPLHPSFIGLPFNLPFIFSVMIFSGVVFALYILAYFGWKLFESEAKPKLLYGLMIIPYLLFAYFYINSFLFSPTYFVLISVLLLASVFFMMYREPLLGLLAEELPVSQLQPEDVCAMELINADLIKKYKIPRLLKKGDIERLQKTKLSDIWIYTRLPPFIPFILLGIILALFFAKGLILI